jgi:dihydropteroate synthase
MKNKMSENLKLMGILNVTPDSFSDGGCYFDSQAAIAKAFSLLEDGANILDIGAESTGPNSLQVSVSEEKRRLELLFLEPKFSELKLKASISVDTYKSEIAKLAIKHGASIVNDVSGLRADPEMVGVVASSNAEVVIMYSKEDGKLPHVSPMQLKYSSIIETIFKFFDERINFSIKNGIDESKIILDPGMGAFLGNDHALSWEVVHAIERFKNRFSKFRFLYGVSRKSFISSLVDSEVNDIASKIVELDLISSGLDIVRTHNILMLKKLLPLNGYKKRANFE